MRITILLAAAAATGLTLAAPAQGPPGPGRAQPDVVKLAPEHKLGPVTFNHTNHTTKNYNIEGKGPVTCVECHHTEQPAADIAKRPSLKTAHPADRTTTLTADLFAKTPDAPAVTACRDCHARAGAKPKLLPEVPQIKHEGSTATITLTNQQAYHRNCGGCHDEAAKQRPGIKAPTTIKCVACHNRK
jgi:cytochrome c553